LIQRDQILLHQLLRLKIALVFPLDNLPKIHIITKFFFSFFNHLENLALTLFLLATIEEKLEKREVLDVGAQN